MVIMIRVERGRSKVRRLAQGQRLDKNALRLLAYRDRIYNMPSCKFAVKEKVSTGNDCLPAGRAAGGRQAANVQYVPHRRQLARSPARERWRDLT
jgi:hypothetical protein